MFSRFLKSSYSGLLFVSLGHFLIDFMIGVWPIYKTIAGIDLALAGMIYAVSATLGEGMQAVFGNLSDRGWRKYLILGGIGISLSAVLFSYTVEPIYLFFLFLIVCIGSGAFHPSAVGYASQLTSKRKSLYITHFAAFGLLGLGLSQIIYTSVYHTYNGHTFILAFPALLLILLACRKSVLPCDITPHKTANPPKFKLFLQFFKNKNLRNLYLSQISNQTVAWGLVFLLPDVLKSRSYSDALVYGGGHLTYILGGVCLLIPSGLIADKFSAKNVIFTATALGSTLFYVFLCFPSLSDEVALVILFGLGACISVVNPVSLALGNRLVPQHPGMVSAFLMGCVWCVSEFVGPGVGGLFTKLFEDDAPARSLMMIGTVLALGLWASSRLPSEVAEESLASLES